MIKFGLIYLIIIGTTYWRINFQRKWSNNSLPYYLYGLILSIGLLIANYIIDFITYDKIASINPQIAQPLWISSWIFVLYWLIKNIKNRIKNIYNINQHIEILFKNFLFYIAFSAIIITMLIIAIMFSKTVKFFTIISPFEFIFGLKWQPTIEPSSASYAIIPLLIGTLLITMIALLIAVPTGLLAAIYLNEYASKKFYALAKPIIEILGSIPSVVYGYFAALFVGPQLRSIGKYFSLTISTESALCASIVMGIMIMPLILMITNQAIKSIPQNLKDASLALGATKAETIKLIVLPTALPTIIGAILLGLSRAIGETMIVTMASGLKANLTLNPFDSVTTITAQIVSLITGDQEFDSIKTLAAFALVSSLFLITLLINFIALVFINKNSHHYE